MAELRLFSLEMPFAVHLQAIMVMMTHQMLVARDLALRLSTPGNSVEWSLLIQASPFVACKLKLMTGSMGIESRHKAQQTTNSKMSIGTTLVHDDD
jgi:hypothetical protein